MVRMIEEVNRIPIERDSLYNEIVRESNERRPLVTIPVG
jgi:2-iminoacetate synthase ThiH